MNRYALAEPLFYRLESTAGLDAPAIRLGEALRTHVRALGGMQKEALVTSARTGASWRLASDEGAYLNGDDAAPCPLSFLTTGMVCSTLNELLGIAAVRGIEIEWLRLIQDNYYTMQGSALRGTMVGGAKDVELEVQLEGPADRATLERLVADAVTASPVSGLLRQRHTSRFALRHNGHEIPVGRVASLGDERVSVASDAAFDSIRRASGGFPRLIVRGGPSPKTREATSSAGSSLAEQQDRTLHVRGICTLLADGMRHVEQQLFNPHGSIFEFLCDEAPGYGGQGRAPDALSYASAGIAFCFMTQLGRYAQIVREPLEDYRIVQDTHFSSGNARTGTPGAAGPVDTHVEIRSAGKDEFAQRALDMSEQTCFLHALCRSELKTKIRVRDFEAATP